MSREPRRAAAAGVVLAVSAAHLLLWHGFSEPVLREAAGWAAPATARAVAVDVRSLAATRSQPEPLQSPVPPETQLAPLRPGHAAARAVPAVAPMRSLPLAVAAARADPTPPQAAAAPATSVESQAGIAAEPPAPPVYATRLPDPGRWRYRMQRGDAVGEAELQFWVAAVEAGQAPGYQVRLTAHAAGSPPIDWASDGRLDAAGLAPERFALRRKGRDRQAANFQRDAGKITFSGPTHALPLHAGAQDRVSWLLQLSGIVAAAPDDFPVGSQVQIYVAGARGDAQVWRFAVEGWDAGDSGLRMLKLVREPVRLYDTRAEIWLDPQRQFLPQRVLQTPQGGGPALDLIYQPGTL